MENNSDRMGFALIALSVVAFVLLAVNGPLKASADGFFKGFNNWQESTFSQILNKINPNDAKWVTKGDWGSNGKFVVDKDGNAVIYAMDASKPIVFHDMWNENAKLPTDKLTTLTFQDKVQGDTDSSMKMAFANNDNLKKINNLDTNVDTSNVVDMGRMFQSSHVTSVGDLSQWNTSNVTNMNSMFQASNLTSVGDLSQWNTSNVTNMSYMFQTSKLASVGDLSKWNTSKVTTMAWMFEESNLTSVGDLSKWNTSKVTSMEDMFLASNLTSVGDLGEWNTSKVTNMSEMFDGSKLMPPAWYLQ